MATFEEYRQPWETGPHWELKREFMEKYKNDYPLDRLLCLAQAYSNIELLHCSYPEPVTQEIYQLSCQLKGCKRFREADADLERRRKEKAEMQPRKAGKRSVSDEISLKPIKFIKFCSPEEVPKLSKQSYDLDKKLSNDLQGDTTPVSSEDLIRKSVAEGAINNCDAKPNLETEASENHDIIFSASRSPDFALIQKVASSIPIKTGKKRLVPLQSIEAAIEASGLENAIKYIYVRENASVICCQFYIGNTLIASGRDATENAAKERAVIYGIEILANLTNLPNKTLSDVRQELENWKKANWNSSLLWSEILSSDLELKLKILRSQLSELEKYPAYTNLHLILSIVEKFYSEMNAKNKNFPLLKVFYDATAKLNCDTEVHFFHFGEDPDTPLHIRNFNCVFVIKNIFICESKASSKKKAKADAFEAGIHLLKNFIENCELEKQNVEGQINVKEKKIESSEKQIMRDISTNENLNNNFSLKNNNSIDEECSSTDQLVQKESKTDGYVKFNADKIPETQITSMPGSGCDSKGKPKLFSLNHRLLDNTRKLQLVLFDSSKTRNHIQTAGSVINTSASKCKKNLVYEKDEIPADGPSNRQKIIRYSITLNNEEIGKAQGFTEKDAKTKAAENALQFLQKQVYTIKVKNEIEDSFIISRDHVLNAENPSSVLPDSNVGCKMLKMMGWTGGGIGKTSGITEPITTNEHRFGQGLGFTNNQTQQRSFKQKIDSLLKDYSKSNTTSDLIFSTEFSKEERGEIHRLAPRYNLTSVSYGKDEERRLFIGRKISPMELLEHLVKAGGSTPKYELVDRSVLDRTSVSQVGGWQQRTVFY